ncbi:hypothetical protein AB6A40_005761 [Gnathostoma spinigerum]|uniref:Condensin complex subunit 1 C-terminal domain-containing protein n=1 Tax=Gnathostoma spinigerum TaxID=75299 RepID=A0ABD6EQT5_9BILA
MNNDEALLDEEDRDRDYHMELSRIENDMKQCEAVITFALDIEKCMGTALKCVMVAQATELVELIDFLVNCSKFNIRHSENAVRELFRAVWRRDDKVREAIVNAGLRLFFSTNPDKEISIRKSAENLIKVALSVPEKHRVSLEEVLYLMIKANMFPVELLDVLSQSICSSQSALRIAAMRIFSIVNKAKKLFMRGKFSFFVELCRRDGFFDGDDGTLAREYFHAIAMLGDTPDMRDLATMGQRPFRIPYSHLVVRCIIGLMVNNFTVKVYRWIPMMESALNALFYITAEPSHCIRDIASQLLRQTKKALAINILSECELNVFDTASARCDQDTNENNTILNESLYEEFEELVIAEERWLNANCDVIDRNCSVSEENVDHFEEETDREALETHKSCKIRRAVSSILRKERNEKLAEFELCAERLCAFIGQVALKTLIHVDVSFVAEIKRKNELLHAIRHMKSQTFTPLLSEEELETFDENTASLLELDSMHRIGFFDFSEDEQDDRLGLTGISEDDRVVDQARQICEHFIFKKGRLLSRLARFVIFLAKTKNKVCSERVQTVAALALSKLMLLSSRVCSGYMPVFIELLSTSTSPECRSNLMIAAGDLCARFPNIVEQYSDALYGRILDNDNYVRMTCLIVLSHLILNDMVKLRSTVADIACCLLDTSVEIVRITRFFFSELALKDNSMYNLMADVISRLLAKDDISIEKFKEIMSYLLSFIKKEKQADSLIVKLAERLPLATGSSGAIDIRTAHCVSYCISRLPLTENSLRKLAAALPTFSHLLSDEVFFSHLMLSVNHFKRFSRNAESKAIQVEVDEFVETLNKLHREKINLEETADRIVMYKRKAGNKSPLKQHRQVRRNLFH